MRRRSADGADIGSRRLSGVCGAAGSSAGMQDVAALKGIGLYEACEEEPIFKQLAADEAGVAAGDPCPLDLLNKYDNMNYFGADGSREMLVTIRERLGAGTAPTKIVDVGAGFGGTSRVMVAGLEAAGCAGSSATALELQPAVSKTASALTAMCELAGDLNQGAVTHGVADVVTGACEPAGCSPADGEADVMVSRLCVLHIPLSARQTVLSRCASWLRPGGVLAFEDYAAADSGLSAVATASLAEDVYVPDGALPTTGDWTKTLEAAGFTDIVVEDLSARWAGFVAKRLAAANVQGEALDAMVGPGRRQFYTAVDALFNPPADAPSGLVGVRIYATKAL